MKVDTLQRNAIKAIEELNLNMEEITFDSEANYENT